MFVTILHTCNVKNTKTYRLAIFLSEKVQDAENVLHKNKNM